MTAFMRSFAGFRRMAPMNRGTTNGLGECLPSPAPKPPRRYRYVRWRWRVLFAVIDFVGEAVVGACRTVRRWARSPTAAPPCQDDPSVILLVQLDHLGDAINSTAMLPALRKEYPEASIEVLAGAWNREVFETSPEVDRVHVSHVSRFARSPARLAWIPATLWWGFRLRRRGVDLGIDVRGDFPVVLILWLCGARRRLGWDCGGGGFLLTHRADFVPNRPEVESRWMLLAELGISPPTTADARRPRYDPPAEARRKIARRLADAWAQGRDVCRDVLVVLHIGAGTRAKRWPLEHWYELLGRIIVDHAAQVVLVGSRNERIIASRLLGSRILGRRAWPGVVDWTGGLTFVELAALLQQADVMVGADSGPAHLAAAVDTPVVVLFSGTNHPRQWRPCGRRVAVVRHEVDCSPCHRQRCRWAEHPCMNGLLPWRVASEIRRSLGRDSCEVASPGHR